MNNVHFILQGKGGVGKSFVAAVLAQYWLSKEREVVCADTDPVNATFTQYKGLNVSHVQIAENGKVIQRNFDPLIEKIAETPADFIIDNGASTFMPLTTYMHENDVYEVLAESGKNVFIHNVLVAGQAKTDTLNGFEELTKRVNGKAKIVIWQNEFFGPIDYDGHPITKLKLYTANASKVAGIVKLAYRGDSDTFTTDLKLMTEKHMTFSETLESTDFGIMAKSRMRKVMNETFAELDKVTWQS